MGYVKKVYTVSDLKTVSIAYDLNYDLMEKAYRTGNKALHWKYVLEERRLNHLDIMIRKSLGLYIEGYPNK